MILPTVVHGINFFNWILFLWFIDSYSPTALALGFHSLKGGLVYTLPETPDRVIGIPITIPMALPSYYVLGRFPKTDSSYTTICWTPPAPDTRF